jgi:hypothetical protein
MSVIGLMVFRTRNEDEVEYQMRADFSGHDGEQLQLYSAKKGSAVYMGEQLTDLIELIMENKPTPVKLEFVLNDGENDEEQ